MSKNDGGPAFPLPEWSYPHGVSGINIQKGMSLRDWFAGMALQGFMANTSRPTTLHPDDAKWAYSIADAMLAEREKRDDGH